MANSSYLRELGAAAILLACLACESSHPTDSELEDLFSYRQADFEKLLAMLEQDQARGVWRVDYDWVRLEGALNEGRWDEYRRMFRTTRLEAGVLLHQDTGQVEFLSSARGLATGGDTKGIFYSTTPPGRIYDSLDRRPSDLESLEYGFKSLAENWYIFYQWDD